MKNDYEEIRLSAKANWLRLAYDVIKKFPTKEQAEQYLDKIAKEAEDERDAYLENRG